MNKTEISKKNKILTNFVFITVKSITAKVFITMTEMAKQTNTSIDLNEIPLSNPKNYIKAR